MNNLLRFTHLGTVFCVVWFLFFFGGIKLDEIWQTQPLFTFVGMLAGFLLGLYYMIQELKK